MKRYVFSALMAAGLCSPVFADTVIKGHNLILVEAVADFSLPVVKNWAANVDTFAAMAAPEVPNAFLLKVTDPRRAVKTGVSEGAKTLEQAKSEALEQCEAVRPKDLMPCVIVATVSPN